MQDRILGRRDVISFTKKCRKSDILKGDFNIKLCVVLKGV